MTLLEESRQRTSSKKMRTFVVLSGLFTLHDFLMSSSVVFTQPGWREVKPVCMTQHPLNNRRLLDIAEFVNGELSWKPFSDAAKRVVGFPGSDVMKRTRIYDEKKLMTMWFKPSDDVLRSRSQPSRIWMQFELLAPNGNTIWQQLTSYITS